MMTMFERVARWSRSEGMCQHDDINNLKSNLNGSLLINLGAFSKCLFDQAIIGFQNRDLITSFSG